MCVTFRTLKELSPTIKPQLWLTLLQVSTRGKLGSISFN